MACAFRICPLRQSLPKSYFEKAEGKNDFVQNIFSWQFPPLVQSIILYLRVKLADHYQPCFCLPMQIKSIKFGRYELN